MSEKKKKKPSPIFDVLNFICTKQYRWNELSEEYRKGYNQFILNRFLSSYEYLLPLLNELSMKRLTNEQHYTILYTWVKRTKHYFNYNAYKSENIDKNLVLAVKKEYDIGNREARRYIDLLTEETKAALLKKWADYIVFVNAK